MKQSEMAFLLNSWWQNLKVHPNQSINDGDMAKTAKCPVSV